MFEAYKGGFTLRIKVIPRANRDALSVNDDGSVVVRVRAVADGGKANAAVINVLSQSFGVPKTRIEILRGALARQKTLWFHTDSKPSLQPD